jgi:hypothetical protein
MKKIFTLLLGAFVLTLMVRAQPEQQFITIPKLADGASITIDGTVDPIWELVTDNYIEYDDPDDYGVTTVFDCFFKMAWNDTALWLLVHRSDDDFADQWETGLADWQSDRDELFFDVNVDTLDDGRGASDSQGGGTGADFGHYQFTSIWVEGQSEWSGMPSQWYHNAPFYFGYKFDGADEYITEYCFPFTSLTINTALLPEANATFQGEAGVTFGFIPVIADVDMSDSPTDQTFRKFMRWVEQGGWESMDTAGHVTLGEETISGIELSTMENGAFAYPSPATDMISLGKLEGSATAVIYDVVGNEVMRMEDVYNDTPIDIAILRSGTYYIVVNNREAIKFSKY